MVDPKTGAVKRSIKPVDFEVEELLASLDGKWLVATAHNRGTVLFDVAGKPTALEAHAFAFTRPDELFFLTFSGEHEFQVRRNLVTGTEKRTPWKGPSLAGALRFQEGKVLSTTGTWLELSSGRGGELGAGEYSWGAQPDTVVRVANAGRVEVLDLEGKVLRSFARPRRGSILQACVCNGALILTTGTYLEVYQLSAALPASATARKSPAARKPVKSAATGDARAALLMEAFFAKPDDVSRLSVWADLLLEHGDSRGEFIQLHLVSRRTPEQKKRLTQLYALGGAMLVAQGFEAIASLNPRLSVRVTALGTKTAARVAALAALKLGRVHRWSFSANSLSDASLALLGPALKGVKELNLIENSLTAGGVTKVLPFLKGLTDLEVDEAVLERPGFRKALLATLPTLRFLNQQHAR